MACISSGIIAAAVWLASTLSAAPASVLAVVTNVETAASATRDIAAPTTRSNCIVAADPKKSLAAVTMPARRTSSSV